MRLTHVGFGIVLSLLISGRAVPAEEQQRAPRNDQEFDELFNKVSNWGRWGKDDEAGTANLVTDAKRKQAASLVRNGITLSLARPEVQRPPNDPGPAPRIKYVPSKTGQVVVGRYEAPAHNDSMAHVDSLCHMSYKGQVYNGRKIAEIHSEQTGCEKNGLAPYLKGIVTRGVLIDIPRLKGVPYLEPGTPVYAEDIEAWEKKAGIKVTPGDAIVLRTGRWARFAKLGEGDKFVEGSAGFHASVALWLKQRDVAYVVQDGAAGLFSAGALERKQIPSAPYPFSILSLAALGANTIVALDLEDLAQTAARLKRWEFMFTAAPLQVPSGTGSPVHPLAVF